MYCKILFIDLKENYNEYSDAFSVTSEERMNCSLLKFKCGVDVVVGCLAQC